MRAQTSNAGKLATVVALVALAAVIGYLAGGGRSTTPHDSAAPVGAEAPPPPAARVAAPISSAHLDEPASWQLIAETRRAAGKDTGEQSSLLEERLSKLSPKAIIDFDRIRRRLDERAYTWKMWGAANVIEDGCSDDCFRDFRGYVISLGRDAYERAMANPDSLASVADDAETGDWEGADNVAPDAYSSRSGDDFPGDDSDLSGKPRGTPINLEDERTLVRLYPQLAARFR